jgi:hypothetical protein
MRSGYDQGDPMKLVVRRLALPVVVAFAAGAIAAQADSGEQRATPRATPSAIVAASPPPARAVRLFPGCKLTKPPVQASTPPSQALLDAFAILRRERRPEDALPAEALAALKRRNLAPVSPESARLLRTGPAGGRAWVVPVPDVSAAFPLLCVAKGKRTAREGLAVVSVGGAAPGGGGALADLVRGRAPVWVDSCAGEQHDMLSVSGIVPNGVASVFLTAPDGTAVRADVKDNGYEFLTPRPPTIGQRYVVWTGGDGTPHVQPVAANGLFSGPVCKRVAALDRTPRVTPLGGLLACTTAVPLPAVPERRRPGQPLRVPWTVRPACEAPSPELVLPSVGVRPVPALPVPKRPK